MYINVLLLEHSMNIHNAFAFVHDKQSVHMLDVTFAKLTSMHFYGWQKGLKTGMYYLRTKAATDAIKFTIDHSLIQKLRRNSSLRRKRSKTMGVTLLFPQEQEDVCLACGS